MVPPTSSLRVPARLGAAVLFGALGIACGSDGAGPELTDLGEEGRSIALQNGSGCAACHGADGAGRVGPAFVGLFGSTVPLEDGSTVVADREYLARSIRDPGAEIVDGYNVQMPPNNLTDDEIDAVVQWIVELGADRASEEEG